MLNQGADWGRIDSKTGTFLADTRYTLKTADSPPAFLYLQTRGPLRPAKEGEPPGLQLHILIETGDERYYYLNNISSMLPQLQARCSSLQTVPFLCSHWNNAAIQRRHIADRCIQIHNVSDRRLGPKMRGIWQKSRNASLQRCFSRS